MVEYIALLAGGLGILIIGLVAIRAAYNNGVCDGYGYAKEPTCPGYARAGEYLRDVMAHRWPELRVNPLDRRKSPREQ